MANTTTFSNSLTGDIFIIPNNSASFSREKIESYNIDFWSDVCDQFNLIKYSMKEQMKDSSLENEEFVELWFTSESCDNWFDHSLIDDNDQRWRPITKYFPKTLFSGKKEGDSVTFPMYWETRAENGDLIRRKISVELKLNQLQYRYRNKGNFEDVLKLV